MSVIDGDLPLYRALPKFLWVEVGPQGRTLYEKQLVCDKDSLGTVLMSKDP